MMGLSEGSSVAFAGGSMMISGSSELSADVKQQRTLSPAQENILNVTFIWRSNRIFLKFVDPKDFESFCREDGILSEGENKPQERLGQGI